MSAVLALEKQMGQGEEENIINLAQTASVVQGDASALLPPAAPSENSQHVATAAARS